MNAHSVGGRKGGNSRFSVDPACNDRLELDEGFKIVDEFFEVS